MSAGTNTGLVSQLVKHCSLMNNVCYLTWYPSCLIFSLRLIEIACIPPLHPADFTQHGQRHGWCHCWCRCQCPVPEMCQLAMILFFKLFFNSPSYWWKCRAPRLLPLMCRLQPDPKVPEQLSLWWIHLFVHNKGSGERGWQLKWYRSNICNFQIQWRRWLPKWSKLCKRR